MTYDHAKPMVEILRGMAWNADIDWDPNAEKGNPDNIIFVRASNVAGDYVQFSAATDLSAIRRACEASVKNGKKLRRKSAKMQLIANDTEG